MSRIIGRADTGGSNPALPRDWRVVNTGQNEEGQARARAAQLLLSARLQARGIIAGAEKDAKGIAHTARVAAWDLGFQEGMQRALQEQAPAVARLAMLIANTVAAHQDTVRHLDETVVSLVLALTRLLVRHEVNAAPDTILQVARAALEELTVEHAVTLRVHPDDAALLQAQLPALGLPIAVQVSVLPDPAVTAGGCLIESGTGRVNASIEKQLERLGSLLNEQIIDA
jgi:flagellar biosynthesis/type III secretory pathway protein FliH